MNNRFQIPKYLNFSNYSKESDTSLRIFGIALVPKIQKFYRRYLKNIGFVRSSVGFTLPKIQRSTNLFFKFISHLYSRRRYSIIRFREYVRATGSPASVLVSDCSVQTLLPKIFPMQDSLLVTPALPSYEFGAIQVATIKNATAIGGTNMIFVDDSVICHDMYDFKVDSTSEELHGRCSIDSNRNEILWFKKINGSIEISTAAVFLDACSHNYAHWITEVLPRIAAFCKQDCFNDIPIIIDDGLHINLMESLGLIVGIGRKLYTLRRDEPLHVESLFLVSATGYVPFGVRSQKYPIRSHGTFSSLALMQMRKFILGKMEKFPKHQWPKKILLVRNSSTRRLLNDNQLTFHLLGRGYKPINTAELTFLEQVQLFSESREIVATTGAALANAIFAPPGAKIYVIMPKHKDMIYKYWLNMLSPLEIDITYILGEPSSNQHLGIHADYVVSDKCISDFLLDMENA